MSRTILTILGVVVALFASIYQLHLKPIFTILGVGRVVEEVGNKDCNVVPQLQACEKIVLHQPTGVLYLACSTPQSRSQWTPTMLALNASGRSLEDYIATYDPQNSRITRLKVSGLPQGLSVHGMDVVPSSYNPKELFVYLVNHQPFVGKDARKFGANSTIEIFKTKVGGATLTHLHTVHNPIVFTPNDIVGSPDGKSFHFTNDASEKTGLVLIRQYSSLLKTTSTVGYCHVEKGCKLATPKIYDANGIARVNDTFYVANSMKGTVTVLERQTDNSLVFTDLISTGQVLDNLSIDQDGMLWAGSIPQALTWAMKHFPNPSFPSPSSALRISLNTGEGVFYGQKFKVQKVFEDGGSIASGITSAVYDAKRRRLFLHGISSPQLAVCKI